MLTNDFGDLLLFLCRNYLRLQLRHDLATAANFRSTFEDWLILDWYIEGRCFSGDTCLVLTFRNPAPADPSNKAMPWLWNQNLSIYTLGDGAKVPRIQASIFFTVKYHALSDTAELRVGDYTAVLTSFLSEELSEQIRAENFEKNKTAFEQAKDSLTVSLLQFIYDKMDTAMALL